MVVRECANVSVVFPNSMLSGGDYFLEVFLIEDTDRIIICDNIGELIDICKSTDYGFQELYAKRNVTAMIEHMTDTIITGLEETYNENLRTYIKENVYEYQTTEIHYTVHDYSRQVDIFSCD